jgi:hypothetical protein
MAGQEQFLLEGGMGGGGPSLTQVGVTMGRNVSGTNAPAPHVSVIALVLFAVVGLWALDKFGFRFAVTAGKR